MHGAIATPNMKRNHVEQQSVPPEAEVSFGGGDAQGRTRSIVQNIVETTIRDFTEKCKERPVKKDTIFFDIVRGGNVRLAQKVLDMLQACGHHHELNCALGIPDYETENITPISRCIHMVCVLLRVLVLLVFIPLFAILTPIWYIIHALTTTIYQPRSTPSHGTTELPLIYAVRSKTRDMIRMFLHRGASISHTDSKGNNVYHYIADLSAHNPNEAIECHKCLLSAIEDVTEVCDVIMTQKNELGLTPFEAIAKYGSLQLFNYIVREDGIFGKVVLYISRDNFKMDRSSNSTVGFGLQRILKAADMRSIGLNMTPSRHSQERQESGPSGISLARHRFDISHYEKGDVHGKQSYILHLLAARDIEGLSQAEIESLSEAKFLKHWMRDKQRVYFRFSILVHMFQISFTILLLAYLALNAGDGDMFPLKMPANMKNLEALYQSMDDINKLNPFKNITMTDLNDSVIMEEVCPGNHSSFGGIPMDKCQFDAFTELNTMCTRMSEQELLNAIDVSFVDPNDKSQKIKSKVSGITYKLLFAMAVAYLGYDIFFRWVFLVNSYTKIAFFDSRVGITSRILATCQRRIPGSYIEKQLNVTAFCLILVHEFLNRTYTETIYYSSDAKYKVDDVFDRDAFKRDVEAGAYDQENHADRIRYTVMACLMMRLLALVLSLRVLPSVGFFVVTTIKLAKTLINFLIIFALVAMSFACIFHFVMRDPSCQAQKLYRFSTLADSLLQTYTVMLGQGSFVYGDNINATIAYVVYTTITCLLLLNLIIAVMGTMADALNRQPWRENLCLMEHLEETLGAEAAWQTLLYPVRLCSKRGTALYHRLTGTYTYGKPAVVEVIYTD